MNTILELDKQELKSISGGDIGDFVPYLVGKAAGGAVVLAAYELTPGRATWPFLAFLFLAKEAVAAKVTRDFKEVEVRGSTAKEDRSEL